MTLTVVFVSGKGGYSYEHIVHHGADTIYQYVGS